MINMKTYPLLQSQMGIFLEWMGEPSATSYNLPCFLSFPKKISAEQLEAALKKLIKSRRILQTRIFIDENGNPLQMQMPEEVEEDSEPQIPYQRESAKIGRNDPCPCGSGKKYKKCCGAN